MYTKGQTVAATVESILRFGVFVRLEGGSRAYVRRRELTLSGDVDPREVVSEGQQIKAVVTALAELGSLMELSIRNALPDPWQEFTRQFKVGDVATATVKNLFPDKVFAQVLPGVDGLIPLRELASWKVERPEDVVWPGDRIEAVITHLDADGKRVQLSICRRLEQLAQVEAIMEVLHKANVPATSKAIPEPEPPTQEVEEPGKIGLAGSILVVEDQDEVRVPLVKWLSDRGCTAHGVQSATEAVAYCQEQTYELIIMDLDMPDVDGLSCIRQLRAAQVAAPVVVMSEPELIAAQLPALQSLGVSAVFPKPLEMDEIHDFLLQLAHGERPAPAPETSAQASPQEVQSFQRLTNVMRSGRPVTERFRQGLNQLVHETYAEMGIVFWLDPVSQKVSLIAHVGNIPLNIGAVYALVDSPVKDVIVEDRIVWENRVSSGRTGRFRKLLDLLPFESCIGVPFQAGGRVENALFLFHREPDAFSRYRVRDAWAMAALFAVALESQSLDRRVQSLSHIFLNGQLAAAFGHEVYNKLSGLDLQFRNLRSDFERLTRSVEGLGKVSDAQQICLELDGMVETAVGLKDTVTGFRRLMQARAGETADVNQAIRQTEAQARPLARRAQVEVRLKLADDLPLTAGSSVSLYQVFLNLALNAIQQMDNKPGDGRRVLTMTTLCCAGDGNRLVQVRFADTGPGIHRQLWEQIFTLGFTTRLGGSGLGLYIARSLVESMGGRITVEESLVPLGTTFLVELPAAVEASDMRSKE